MGGLGILIIIGVYFFAAYKIITAMKTRAVRYVITAVLVLIPTADAVVGRLYLHYLCASEGGLKVYRVVENVDGFLGSTPFEMWVTEGGYKFSEGSIRSNGNVKRVSLRDGKVFWEENVPPKSLYRLRLVRIGEGQIFGRDQYVVDVIQTSELLAAYTQISFKGGWAERFLAAFTDAGPGAVKQCDLPRSHVRHAETAAAALRPAK